MQRINNHACIESFVPSNETFVLLFCKDKIDVPVFCDFEDLFLFLHYITLPKNNEKIICFSAVRILAVAL